MARLKLLAGGTSPQAQAQARGKLFENLMADVLRHYGYRIDRIPSVNYAGMEIDIEGKALATGIPLYAECKCYETEVDSPKLQAFYGKYMALWLKERRCQGLFIALPGVNSHAKGFYRENCEETSEITVRLLQEDQVIESLYHTMQICRPDSIAGAIRKEVGTPGDWILLYTDKGLFYVQYLIAPGAGIPSGIALFDAKGTPLTERTTLDYLAQLYPEFNDFEKVAIDPSLALGSHAIPQDLEEIVEVRGSSECFEYQFPASPQHFVGRESVLEEVDLFVTKVINKETSSRGILFEANSGWGKSSVVLASVARLKEIGHFAVAIDSRSASSSQFILRALDYVLSHMYGIRTELFQHDTPPAITGFDGAVRSLLALSQTLQRQSQVMVIFFDQFENVFFLSETLKRITDLLLRLCDAQTNVILGFSWKTDLVGLTSEFPYQLRDSIVSSSRRLALETFSEVETTALLDRLSEELRAPLRKDLRFFLSEFSQGYPWLLKKLCAHVKAQRETGVPQSAIANSLLNVEELFKEDLRGLSPDEEDALRRVAKKAPISISELGEELRAEVVQSLVNRRLVVRIGHKFDVYWDIFRDYLNTGRVPVQENYILRLQIGSVLNAAKLLTDAGGTHDTSRFQQRAGLSQKSFYNVMRDMRLLGVARVDGDKVVLQVPLPKEERDFKDSFRAHLKERLRRNRLVWRLLEVLEAKESLRLDEMAEIIARSCPYISATRETWRTYARVVADWMDFADVAIFDNKDNALARYRPGTEVRERQLSLGKRRGGMMVPAIQYTPVEKVAERLVQALQGSKRIDWTGLKKSSIAKALATLEDLEFIVRKPRSITVLSRAKQFVSFPEQRATLFAEGALKMRSFVAFVDILREHKDTGRTLSQLGVELRARLSVEWTQGTAETEAKIMLDWARHTMLAPGVFAESRRGPRRVAPKGGNLQTSLFPKGKE